MADWSRAKLGDVRCDVDGQWWAVLRVPVDGPDDDPRKAPPRAASGLGARKVPRRAPLRVSVPADGGDDD